MIDRATLADLVTFARIEADSGDLEPWAALLRTLRGLDVVTDAEAGWLVKLYNAFDDFGSAWAAFRLWPSLGAWLEAFDRDDIARFPCTQERRNLRGGKVVVHLNDYARRALPDPDAWLRSCLAGDHPEADWGQLLVHLRTVWGVGRQTAFEWAEFAMKVNGVPVSAPDACLWESSGPRRALERIWDEPNPSPARLDAIAAECRDHLAAAGVPLAWVDFETVICDFNVMRDGRYYPGRHLAALRAEIQAAPAQDRAILQWAWENTIPDPWVGIAAGIDKSRLRWYRDSGRIVAWP